MSEETTKNQGDKDRGRGGGDKVHGVAQSDPDKGEEATQGKRRGPIDREIFANFSGAIFWRAGTCLKGKAISGRGKLSN